MKTNKRLNFIFIVSFFAVILMLFIVGSFLDLQIAKSFDPEAVGFLDMLGDVLGEVPGYLLLAFACCMSLIGLWRTKFKKLDTKGKIFYVGFFAVFLIGMIASYVMMFKAAAEHIITGSYSYALAGILALIMAGVTWFMFKGIKPASLERIKKWCLITIIAMLAAIVVTYLLKYCWGRQRFYDMTDPSSQFRHWWQPLGFSTESEFHSFPSGHSLMASCSFFLVPLAAIISRDKFKWQLWANVFATVFTLFVILCRIAGGHHFMTDTAVGMFIGFTAYALSTRIGYGKNYDNYLLRESAFTAAELEAAFDFDEESGPESEDKDVQDL